MQWYAMISIHFCHIPIQVDAVQKIFQESIGNDGQQDSIFEAKDKLHRSTFAQGWLIRMNDEIHINDRQLKWNIFAH